ncbi:MAG TPA: M36 family metallopeptidase, partial [Thermoanaerobaculia bacterium]|nr:M36 family metallopeptidase [Thermoanaerobaculia bacterium]
AAAAAFLRAEHGAGVADSLVVRSTAPGPRGALTHVRFGQEVAGLSVYGAYVKAAVDPSGRVVSVVENLATGVGRGVAPARIGEAAALAAALALHHPGVDAGDADFFHQPPTVERVAVPRGASGFAEGFVVVTWSEDDNLLWHTLVDGDGEPVHAELRTNTDSYLVFPDHPGNSAQTLVAGPGAGNAESPIGWVTSNTTIGNNVDAYLDRDDSDSADANGRPVSSTQSFAFAVDLSQEPTISVNQQAAVTNLFYLNNVIHDKLYRHGFVEGAGNFQQDNFGRGGSGNDPVNAEAQDGGGVNNANFATPTDGSRPRMQMFLWTTTSPGRDGDLDSDIVWHEYGHGLTWRMIGGMSGALAGAIGEGMGDVLSIYANRNPVVGEYATNDPGGIRRFPYDDYPLTYGDVAGSSVHADGEIYAGTMWHLLELWEAAGFTQDALYDAVIGGMNFTPSRPAYEDMRDGILAASPTQAQDCVVWQAFADFGIGVGADGVESCRIFSCDVTITESFAVPAECTGGGGNTAPTATIAAPADGAGFTEGDAVTFSGGASDAEDGDLSAGLVWTSSRDGQIGSGAAFTTTALSAGSHTITATVTDSGNLSGSDSIAISVQAAGGGGGITLAASGRKVKGVQTVDLSWSGAASTSVDVFRNGALITTTANDGAHTDSTGQKGGGTHQYQVCEAGTSVCSNVASVVF